MLLRHFLKRLVLGKTFIFSIHRWVLHQKKGKTDHWGEVS